MIESTAVDWSGSDNVKKQRSEVTNSVYIEARNLQLDVWYSQNQYVWTLSDCYGRAHDQDLSGFETEAHALLDALTKLLK